MDDNEIRSLLSIAASSILAADRGEYCECAEPDSLGMACGRCRRRIKAEEVRKVVEIVGCHEHVPGKLEGHMCKVCTMWPDDPRHHGIAAIGRTSWGEYVHPLLTSAPNDNVTFWTVTT